MSARTLRWTLAGLLLTGAAGCNCASTADLGGHDSGHGDGGPPGDGGRRDGGPGGGGDSGVQDSGNFYYDGGCGPIDAGNPPYSRLCAPPTDNECDGTTDAWLSAHGVTRLNGPGGNGYDDDCDGQVDEGCSCNTPGQTKPCYDVSPSQVGPNGLPVGWCAMNSVGTVDCQGTEVAFWSGNCRGAQPPYAHDVCGPGDFNCDGLDGNPDNTGCDCPNPSTCPTIPITEAPYPNPAAIQLIDGSQWIDPAQRSAAANWTWTILGGDCDTVLPFPTFAIYNGTNTATATRMGTRTPVKFDPTQTPQRYVSTPGAPLISIQAVNTGSGVAGGQIYPAFSLSGDYVVQGEWDIGAQHYVCTQKVQVRAPGIRAEACWGPTTGHNDLDLHFARMQGISCPDHGWDTLCPGSPGLYEDCNWTSTSGCRDSSGSPPGWGYADSPDTACVGWGSERVISTQHCTNPRLDLDNIQCDATDSNPLDVGYGKFCGPENINLDNPNDGDAFVVGLNYFGNSNGSPGAFPHVDIYCNGQRLVTAGYNPANGQTTFPEVKNPGGDSSGDFWMVATVKAHVAGGQITSCDVNTIPSHHADVSRDGSTTYCVESTTNMSSPAFSYTSHSFVDTGSQQGIGQGSLPATPAEWCKH